MEKGDWRVKVFSALAISITLVFLIRLDSPTGLFSREITNEDVLYDKNGNLLARKLVDVPEYQTRFTSVEEDEETLTVRFTHNSNAPEPVWVRGKTVKLNKKEAAPGEEVILTSKKEKYDKTFELHVGKHSEVFSFETTTEEIEKPEKEIIPPAPFEVTAEPTRTTSSDGRSTQLSISSCGVSVNESSTLSTSISGTGTCLTITRNNVVLDCLGNTITFNTAGAAGTSGIRNSFTDSAFFNITIQNCIIIDGNASGSNGAGIEITSGSNITIVDNTIQTNGTTTNYGIEIVSGIGLGNISDNTINAFGTLTDNDGIFVPGTTIGLTIENNVINTFGTSDNDGIEFSGINTNVTITNNSISTNGTSSDNDGVDALSRLSKVSIFDNTIRTNGTSGNDGVVFIARNFAGEILNNNSIENNTIVAGSTTGTSAGVRLTSTGTSANRAIINTSVFGNTITMQSGDPTESNDGIVIDAANTFNFNTTLVRNNNIATTSIFDFGISIETDLVNSTVSTFSGNAITGPGLGFFWFRNNRHRAQDIDTTNTVNGGTVFYYGGAGSSPACPGTHTGDAGHVSLIGCTGTTIQNGEFHDPIFVSNGTSITIQNVTVQSRGTSSVSAIDFYGTLEQNAVIRGNTILSFTNQSGNDVLYFNHINASNALIELNFFNITDGDTFGAGISIFGDNATVRHNTMYANNTDPAFGTESNGLVVFNNTIFSIGGISIDANSANMSIYNNTVYHSGPLAHEGSDTEALSHFNDKNVTVVNNTIYLNESMEEAIVINTYDGTLVANNTVFKSGELGSLPAITVEDGSGNVSVLDNKVHLINNDTAIFGGSGIGIGVDRSFNITVNRNTINVSEVDDGEALVIDRSANVTMGNNNITINISVDNVGVSVYRSNGSLIFNNSINMTGNGTRSIGIRLGSNVATGITAHVINSTVENNTVFINSSDGSDDGLLIGTIGIGNKLRNNNLTLINNHTYAVAIITSGAQNNTFSENQFFQTVHWIRTVAGSLNNFTNNTFNISNASVKFHNFTISGAVNITRSHINLTLGARNQSQIFANTTAFPFLNTSAEITFRNITEEIHPKYSLFDNFTYEWCYDHECYNKTFNNVTNEYTYNVSHFTTHTFQICPLNITNTTNLTEDITCPRTAINITASNTEFSCNGFRIHYDGFGEGNDSGILSQSTTNLTISGCTILDLNATGLNSSGVRFVNVDNSFIANNLIRTNASHNSSAVRLEDSELIAVNDNTLVGFGDSGDNMGANVQNSAGIFFRRNTIDTFGFLGPDNYGILLNGSTNSSFVLHNNITTRGFDNNHGVFVRENSSVNTINNNTINATGAFNVSGILLFLNVFNTSITNNTIIAEGTNSTSGIKLQVFADRSQIINNTINVLGSDSNNSGIRFFSLSRNNTIRDTVIFVNGTQDNTAIYLSNGSDENSFNNTLINVTGTNSYGIQVQSIGYNSWFNRTVLLNVTEWILSGIPAGHDYDFENTSFVTPFGNNTFVQNFSITGANDINTFQFNITDNRSFVNSSRFQFLNTSAEIRLNGITLPNPAPFFDFEDDDTYTECVPPQCTELGFAGGIFLFNVSRWTTYVASVAEVNESITVTKSGSPDPVFIGNLLNYTINISATGSFSGITAIENYPPQVTFVSAQPTPTSGNNTFSIGTLTNQTFVINITVRVAGNVANGTVINNTVNVTSNATNVSANASTTVMSCTVLGSNSSSNTLQNCTIDTSDVSNSTIIDSFVNQSTVINSTIDNSSVVNSSVSNSTINNSIVTNSTVNDSNIIDTNLTNSTAINSNITNSTKINSTIINSTITNSFNINCTIINGVEIGGTCFGSTIINGTASNSNITNSTLNNSNSTNSNINNTNSFNSSLENLTGINATVENGTCIAGTIIFNGVTFACPANLTDIYSTPPPSAPAGPSGGGGGSSARSIMPPVTFGPETEAPTVAPSVSDSKADAEAAVSQATASVSAVSTTSSVAAASSTGIALAKSLGNCFTVFPTVNYSFEPIIPEGYTQIGTVPFNCAQTELLVNAPKGYDDVKALRCKHGICVEIRSNVSEELYCNNTQIQVLRKTEQRPIVVQQELPIVPEGTFIVSKEKPALALGNYLLTFEGIPDGLIVQSKQRDIELPNNPTFVLLGRIVEISTNKPVIINLDARYSQLKLESVWILAHIDGEWKTLKGTNTIDGKIILSGLSDHARDGKVTFTVVGIVCRSCIQGTLTRVHTDGVSRKALVLVHGLTATSLKFASLVDEFRLTNQPWQVWLYEYPYTKTIDENAADLATLLEQRSAEFDEVHILGHSLGGLVAQQALAYSPALTTKVKSAIIVGTPNEGSPAVEVYRSLLENVFNANAPLRPFTVDSKVLDELANGKKILPVSNVEYQTVVGLKPVLATAGLFSDENDGVLSTKSGYTIGGTPFNNPCANYHALNISHMELDENQLAIKTFSRIINKKQNATTPLTGYNQYIRVHLADCANDDTIILIGKPTHEFNPCNCGNKTCDAGETPINCPRDCARWNAGVLVNALKWPAIGLGLLLLLALIAAAAQRSLRAARNYFEASKKQKKHSKKTPLRPAPKKQAFAKTEQTEGLLTSLRDKLQHSPEHELARINKQLQQLHEQLRKK